jgi:hypothetical protein
MLSSRVRAHGVSRKLPGNFVSPRVSRPRQARLRRSREAPVRLQRQVLDRHARSRKRHDTRQLSLPMANHPRLGGALWWSALQEDAMLHERIVAGGGTRRVASPIFFVNCSGARRPLA